MDFNKLTQKLQEAVASAQSLASSGGHPEIDNLHLFEGFTSAAGGLAAKTAAEDEYTGG